MIDDGLYRLGDLDEVILGKIALLLGQHGLSHHTIVDSVRV